MRVTVLGTRGSVPVSGKEFEEFGGATSCYLVEAGAQSIILDAGTGIIRAPRSFETPPSILLSHLHFDHLMGLGMYGRLSMPGAETRLLAAQGKHTVLEAMRRLYSPPLWPVSPTEYAGNLVVERLPSTSTIGDVLVECVEGNHPGGCSVIKLTHRGKVLVYATDYEFEPASFERLVAFARGVDLILFEAQYEDAELHLYQGFGHSSARIGLDLMKRANAGRMLLVHHDPRSDDETLRKRERSLGRADVRFAREGEVVVL
ncbi:MAG: MBL fold metallo-hydrolase [Atopobiaceae bacterium]|nr:MBL fold metallo-hydrolase [Atopobiaceae bacterium]